MNADQIPEVVREVFSRAEIRRMISQGAPVERIVRMAEQRKQVRDAAEAMGTEG
jgi:hypothetical protein